MGQGVDITIGGKARRIKFTINTIRAAEKILGRSAIRVLGDVGQMMLSCDDQTTLLWAGLQHEQKTLTIDGAGVLLQKALDEGLSLADVAGKIAEAVADCGLFGKMKPEGDGDPSDSPATPADPPVPEPTA